MAEFGYQRRPTFWWQAALLLLPVGVLAVVGFLSLRQDKLLARQEAVQRADSLVQELASQIWLELTRPAPDNPHQFKVNQAAQLVFPPPFDPNPTPHILAPSALSPAGLRLWQAAQQTEAAGREPAQAITAYRDFLQVNPPGDFAAAAHYALGLLLAKQTNDAAAVSEFELVRDHFSDATGESGLPLNALAALKIIELNPAASPSQQSAAIEPLGSNLVFHPLAISAAMLDFLAHQSKSP